MSDPQLWGDYARAMLEKAGDELHIPAVQVGTVRAYYTTDEYGPLADVQMDGDDEAVQVPVWTGVPLTENDRVAVQFNPPHGAAVIGFLTQIVHPITFTLPGPLFESGSPVYRHPQGMEVLGVQAMLKEPASVDLQIDYWTGKVGDTFDLQASFDFPAGDFEVWYEIELLHLDAEIDQFVEVTNGGGSGPVTGTGMGTDLTVQVRYA